MPTIRIKNALIASLAVMGVASPLMAGVRVITGHDLRQGEQSRVTVVTRPVAVPAATVSRELSQQPVHPHLIEVRYVNTTLYLDPNADYIHQGVNRIDDNHSLVKAQRLGRSLRAKGVTVIYGSPQRAALDPMNIEPRAVIMRPMRGPVPQHPGDMPIVPQPPEKAKDPKTVAMAF